MKVETIELSTAKIEITKLTCTRNDVVLFFVPDSWDKERCYDFGAWLAKANVLPTGCKFAVLPAGMHVQVVDGKDVYEALGQK